jgi:hypothetical protein
MQSHQFYLTRYLSLPEPVTKAYYVGACSLVKDPTTCRIKDDFHQPQMIDTRVLEESKCCAQQVEVNVEEHVGKDFLDAL